METLSTISTNAAASIGMDAFGLATIIIPHSPNLSSFPQFRITGYMPLILLPG